MVQSVEIHGNGISKTALRKKGVTVHKVLPSSGSLASSTNKSYPARVGKTERDGYPVRLLYVDIPRYQRLDLDPLSIHKVRFLCYRIPKPIY